MEKVCCEKAFLNSSSPQLTLVRAILVATVQKHYFDQAHIISRSRQLSHLGRYEALSFPRISRTLGSICTLLCESSIAISIYTFYQQAVQQLRRQKSQVPVESRQCSSSMTDLQWIRAAITTATWNRLWLLHKQSNLPGLKRSGTRVAQSPAPICGFHTLSLIHSH